MASHLLAISVAPQAPSGFLFDNAYPNRLQKTLAVHGGCHWHRGNNHFVAKPAYRRSPCSSDSFLVHHLQRWRGWSHYQTKEERHIRGIGLQQLEEPSV
jgi:hypothetical protein